MTHPAGPVARIGPVPRGRGAPTGDPRARRPTTTSCCRSTRTSTRWDRAHTPSTCCAIPRRSAPSSSTADRGGDVTYHGPGQLVGYPIVSLQEWRAGQRDVVAYVRMLEDVLISVLADFGIGAERSRGYTGVWIGDEKIAAIGVRVSRGRTRHGFALNVDPDLSMFGHIVPCGIRDRGVTSMARVLGRPVEMREVVDRAVDALRGAPSVTPTSTVRMSRGSGSAAAEPARGHSDHADAEAPGVDACPGTHGRRVPRAQAARARSRPSHGVRGSGLPEHLRVLERSHGDVHDPRRPVHARVRVLSRRHAKAAHRRRRRAPTGCGRGRLARPGPRGDHLRRA